MSKDPLDINSEINQNQIEIPIKKGYNNKATNLGKTK
jgi:hypothetical protein